MSIDRLEFDLSNAPRFVVDREGSALRARLSGDWTADQAASIEECALTLLEKVKRQSSVILDLARIEHLDTIGAWVIDRTLLKLRSRGCRANLVDARPEHHTLIGEIDAYRQHGDRLKGVPPRGDHDPPELLVDIGDGVAGAGSNIIGALSFLGEVVVAIGRILAWRGHFRAPGFVHQMELIVLRGVPIIVLIAFAVGGIIAQQGIFQLRRFAAADLVVELISILTLRELGVLLASIMVAGRSGSSFTAELGA